MGCAQVTRVFFILICIVLILLTGWYWYYLYLAAVAGQASGIVLYVLSGVILLGISILGLVCAIKRISSPLIYFIWLMIAMFILGVIQVILGAVSILNCDNPDSPFYFLCAITSTDSGWKYWAPTISILVGNLVAAVIALIFRSQIKDLTPEERDNYY